MRSLQSVRPLGPRDPLLSITHAILGDPGAASRDDAIFSGERYFLRESLFQELKSPWELILNGPVPEVVKFCPSHLPGKYFSGQSAGRSRRVTLSSSSLVDLVVGPVQREGSRGEKKRFNEAEEIANRNMVVS